MFEIKPYLLIVEGKEDEEFFRWLLWEENDIEVKSAGGKSYLLPTAKLLEDIVSPKNWMIIQDRNYRPGWEKICFQEEELFKFSKENRVFILKWTELENIYFFFLKSLDNSKFTEVIEFIHENVEKIKQIVFTKICKSLIFQETKIILNQELIKDCEYTFKLVDKAEEEIEKIFNALKKDEENIFYLLPMKSIFECIEKDEFARFNLAGYIKKKAGIGLKRLHEDEEKLKVRKKLLSLFPIKRLLEKIKKELKESSGCE